MFNKKSLISIALTVCIIFGLLPAGLAAQSNEYTDPADVWMTANGRTNELDINATITYETQMCYVCNKETSIQTYRVPEYTKSGETAYNHGVFYSDGTNYDGQSFGNVDDGTPGKDAYYTGMHWTKSVCQSCGTINSVLATNLYGFNKNVYIINSCDSNFFLDFDNTTYEQYNEKYHRAILKKGQYCQFCKGTYARANEKEERHSFTESVDGQSGNSRFYVTEVCEDCGYTTAEYVAAKSVISSYYGKADGEAHTVTVSDLSDGDVHTSIRYGEEAEKCTKTSAPNYTEAGYYPVYYKITYSYGGEDIVENGVSYVWLLEEDKDITIIVPPADDSSNKEEAHVHDYRYIEAVTPSCTDLGYERWQCTGCGALEKKNYTPAKGHSYDEVEIKAPTCTQNGLILHLCKDCGDFYTETTAVGSHSYESRAVEPTCKSSGYTEHTCKICGDKYVTDIVPLADHSFAEIVKAPSCTEKGYTTHICTECNLTTVTDYTDPTGHGWDEGTEITASTCLGEGVLEYTCNNCGEKRLQAVSAVGHTPGAEADCTNPQICEVCGAVLEPPKGHNYAEEKTEPTCTEHGFTRYVCESCGDSYTSDYTEVLPHKYEATVTEPTCTSMGFTVYICSDCGDSYIAEYTEKLPHSYEKIVTTPTCTKMGFTTYTCSDCGDSFVTDYTDVLEHNYNKQTVEPTCTEHGYSVYTCPNCGKEYIGDYTDEKQHRYTEKVVLPTCTEMGFTVFTCKDCGDSYKGNYTDKIPHEYEAVVTAPTCTAMGYTTYTCKACGDNYTGDYTDVISHNYKEVVTAPTCSEIGFSTFTCEDCGKSYQGNETAKIPHSYGKAVTEPTCTSMGFTTYTCKACGEVEVNDYTDKLPHSYEKAASLPTCSEFGFTTYTCKVCGESYVGDYTDKLPHSYEKAVTAPTCTELGFSVFTCKECGYSYKGEYIEALGHTPTPWIIDAPATIENEGSKHIECGRCNTVLRTETIPQLIDTDHSDEDGGSKVGNYTILIADEGGKPVFDSEISIDVKDNITIKLPSGRLLDYEDRTAITVYRTETLAPVPELQIFVYDSNNNAATGKTNDFGKLTVPNSYSSAGDNNGTIGGGEDKKFTYVVTVTDKMNVVIPNCELLTGESNNIVVKLPNGLILTPESPATVTVTDQNGKPQKDITVIVIGDKDYIEKGVTDVYGKVTLPPVNSGYTDDTGMVDVRGFNVIVNDEHKFIENALVTLNEDGTLSVVLPSESLIDYSNRITVTVLSEAGEYINDLKIIVSDVTEKSVTDITNEKGKIVVPPLSEDYTDEKGFAVVNGMKVVVTDETKPIVNAFVKNENGKISVTLPDGSVITTDNRITVIVTDSEDKPLKDMPVEVSDNTGNTETDLTNSEGKVTDPKLNEDYTDVNGSATVNNLIVLVQDEKSFVEKAFVVHNEDGSINITLPDANIISYENRITVTVLNRDLTPVAGKNVTVADVKENTRTDITNEKGVIVVPPLSEDKTDEGGNSGVGENTEKYDIEVKNTKGIIEKAFVEIKDGKIYITLPDGFTLTTSNQTTVTVKKDGNAVKGIFVTVTDNKGKKASKTTDSKGRITVPVKSSGGGGGSSKRSGGTGVSVSTASVTHKAYILGYPDGTFRPNGSLTRSEAAAIFARVLAEKKGEKIKGSADFTDVKADHWYADYVAYLAKYNIFKGYEDGSFRPNNPISRSELAAVCVRFFAKTDKLTSSKTNKFTDVKSNNWAYEEILTAAAMDWIKGYPDSTFRGDNPVTRAEAVAMVNRVLGRSADKSFIDKNTVSSFSDVTDKEYWAYYDIAEAANEHETTVGKSSESWSKVK